MSEEERVAERAKNALGIHALYIFFEQAASDAILTSFTHDYFTETSLLYDIIISSP